MSKGRLREEKRLRRIFERAMWLAVAVPVFLPLACGATKEGTHSGSAGNAGAAGSSGSSGSAGSSAGNAGAAGATGGTTGGTGQVDCTPTVFAPEPADTCGDYVRLPCGLPSGAMPQADCFLTLGDCAGICPGPHFNCHAVEPTCVDGGIVPGPTGSVDVDCATCPNGVGRIPAGLVPAQPSRCDEGALGDYFAAASHLEAASVHAFRRLRHELASHRAPARLLRAAGRAQRDEVRHARVTAKLARRFGAVPPRVQMAEVAPRSLEDIAIENAVEGCVRETYGALFASFQAAHAQDREIARRMEVIAADETRHAALSWSIARWALRHLGKEARGQIASRCREAVAGLRRDAAARVPEELAISAGVPLPAQQAALLDALEAQLWPSLRAN